MNEIKRVAAACGLMVKEKFLESHEKGCADCKRAVKQA